MNAGEWKDVNWRKVRSASISFRSVSDTWLSHPDLRGSVPIIKF